uniref:Uncharacterized protein ycf72 n=2 Tax=Aegilops tauschii subsp. strangulata TaxID=200361 RepID=A0A453NVS9_AEGTS
NKRPLRGVYLANTWIRLYPNFFGSPQHYPLVRLLLSSFGILNGPPQMVILKWPIYPFAISFATAPATLANSPPLPRVISMLCMAVPKGISVEVDSSFLSKNPFPNCTSFFQS